MKDDKTREAIIAVVKANRFRVTRPRTLHRKVGDYEIEFIWRGDEYKISGVQGMIFNTSSIRESTDWIAYEKYISAASKMVQALEGLEKQVKLGV